MDEDLLMIITNFFRNNYIQDKKLANFIMNEIKYVGNLNAKQYFLDWISRKYFLIPNNP